MPSKPAAARPEGADRWTGRILRAWIYGLPLLVCLGIMLPRLADAHFGLLDDGFNITAARQILGGDLSMPYDLSRGRFRPAYWLLFALLYRLGGLQPVWFFAANTLMFCATTLGLVYLIRRFADPLQAGLAGLFYALAVPGIENYYTFSKGEAFQLTCLVYALITVLGLANNGKRLAQYGRIALAALLVYLAAVTKETTVVLIPAALVWAALIWFPHRRERQSWRSADLRVWLGFLAAVVIGCLAYLLSRSLALGSAAAVNEQRFTLSAGALLDSAVRWTGWLLRDFLFLAPLLLLLLWALWRRRSLTAWGLPLFALVWMAGWIAVYLPWSSANDYFLLPLSLGAAVLAANAVAQGIRLAPAGLWARGGQALFLALSAMLFVASLLTGFSSARVQLAVDHANADLLDYLAANLPADSRLLVNIQDPNEYFDEIRIYLNEILGRPDVQVAAVQAGQSASLTAGDAPLYLLDPVVHNQMLLTVRMGVIEDTLHAWDAVLPEYLGDPPVQPLNRVRQSFQNFTFDTPRLFCSLIRERGFCATPQPLLDRRIFEYGWDVYALH